MTGLVARAVDGPVILVAAEGQELPELGIGVEVVWDASPGRGPLEGLRAGIAALAGSVDAAYVSATDVPLLHPRLVTLVIEALAADVDVALPCIGGHRQLLAGAYRTAVLPRIEELLASGQRRLGRLVELGRVRELQAGELLADSLLGRADPELESLHSLDEPAAYRRALLLPAPEVCVKVARNGQAAGTGKRVRAWTVAEAAAAAGVGLASGVVAALRDGPSGSDGECPLAGGDLVTFRIPPPGDTDRLPAGERA